MNDFLIWSDNWLLGIQILDDQHKGLAESLNSLVMECAYLELTEEKDKTKHKEILSELMDDLHDKTKEHFETEEALMRMEAFPGLTEHAREHIMLLGELKSTFAAKIRDGDCDMDPAILRSLKSWYIVHIARSDQEFARFLQEKNGNKS